MKVVTKAEKDKNNIATAISIDRIKSIKLYKKKNI